VGEALTEHARRRTLAPSTAGGLLACALLLIPLTARADDSLWGKALNTIGLGGNGSGNQGAAVQQPAAPAPQLAPATPAPQPAPAAQAPQLVPAAQAPQPASAALAAPPRASGDNQNILPDFFGWGRHGAAQPSNQAAIQPQGKALTPVEAPQAPAPASEPGLWDRMLGNVGLNTSNATNNIYYADRPKLNIPKARSLPQPAPVATQTGVRPTNPEDLLQPPTGYLEKVRGADGATTGLRSGDISKDKKFFGMF
jgi:pyruvate/2-oxoglutarate dehydrogenase complex dihydrolipoamide acyltransferase (E2) component